MFGVPRARARNTGPPIPKLFVNLDILAASSKLILITNDDGIQAPGLTALVGALQDFGELWVVAPEGEQSGVGHGFSLRGPLQALPVTIPGATAAHAVKGTPVDAVKLAVRGLLPHPPALVVSGINYGENSGVDIFYSGTVAAAMEAAAMGLPAVALSQVRLRSPAPDQPPPPADYTAAAAFARRVCGEVLQRGLPPGVVLNVNIPPRPPSLIRGVRLTRQGASYYEEGLERRDRNGVPTWYWTRWEKTLSEDGEGSDVKAIRDGYISVTPLHLRLTEAGLLSELARWKLTEP